MKTKNTVQILKPDVIELRKFGLLMAWAFPLFIGVIAPFILGKYPQWWTLLVSILFLFLVFISPKSIYYPYRVWMFIGGIVGWINTRIILGITFYLLIFPIGMVLRLSRKLQYKTHCCDDSNYVQRSEELKKEQLERPF